MSRRVRPLGCRRTSGSAAVEYVVVAVLIAIAGIASYRLFGQEIRCALAAATRSVAGSGSVPAGCSANGSDPASPLTSNDPAPASGDPCPGGICMLPGKCFAAGTLVWTATGLQPIETIEVGIQVLSRDEQTDRTEWKPVTQTFVNTSRSLVRLTVTDGLGSEETIWVTPNHRLNVRNAGWEATSELVPGRDALITFEDRALTVLSAESFDEHVPVYNFTVADFHSYFVGEHGLWAHNRGDLPDPLAPLKGQVDPAVLDGLYRALFDDRYSPGVLNSNAYTSELSDPDMKDFVSHSITINGGDLKKINDSTQSHEQGDAYLAALGTAIKNAVRRAGGTVFRVGGDTYVVYFPGQPPGPKALQQAISDQLRKIYPRTPQGPPPRPPKVDNGLPPAKETRPPLKFPGPGIEGGLPPKQAYEAIRDNYPQFLPVVTETIFKDPNIPGLYNKTAFQFLGPQGDSQSGFVAVDINGLGKINSQHGFNTGTHVINAVGGAIFNAATNTGAQPFHLSGDEFATFGPNPSATAQAIKDEVSKLPAVDNKVAPSVSVGTGATLPQADAESLKNKPQNQPPAGDCG
jgi:GGDEF domain-containing protein/Flp pilus assembly pilin Flp